MHAVTRGSWHLNIWWDASLPSLSSACLVLACLLARPGPVCPPAPTAGTRDDQVPKPETCHPCAVATAPSEAAPAFTEASLPAPRGHRRYSSQCEPGRCLAMHPAQPGLAEAEVCLPRCAKRKRPGEPRACLPFSMIRCYSCLDLDCLRFQTAGATPAPGDLHNAPAGGPAAEGCRLCLTAAQT